jgi:cytoskeletal protein CcmA (bactofilin family)
MVTVPAKSDQYPTVIGADANFQGAIKTPGKVLVSQEGKVKAEIAAGDVTIDGSVEGNITSEGRVQLNASGKLKGDVRAGKMQMAEGATWSGRCEVGPNAGKNRPVPDTTRQLSDAASGKK